MRSIASRLFWTQLVASVCLAMIVCVLLYIRVSESLSSQFDQALGGKATSLSALMRIGPKGLFADFDDRALPEFSRNDHAHYLQVVDSHDKPVFRSRSLGQGMLPVTAGATPVRYRDMTLPDGSRGRCVVLKFTPTYDEDAYAPATPPENINVPTMLITLAQSRVELDDRLYSFLTALVAAGLTMSVGIVLVTFVTVRSGLLHLRQFASKVEGIYIDQLDSRIDEKSVPVELLPISMRLNELLQRLEAAFHRERRFTADAAHELRTPIAELRTLAEVALHKTAGTNEPDQFFQDALGVAKQMESLVAALLTLARGQSEKDAGRTELLDVSTLILATWDRLPTSRPARGLQISHYVDPGLHVIADPVILTSIFNNLLSNAIDYTAIDGTLDWRLESIDGFVRFSLENSNDSLSPEDLAHLTEPFWRKSISRNGQAHSGLGLALVKAWSESIGADLRFSLSPDGHLFRTRFSLKQAAGQAQVAQTPPIRDTASLLQ